MAADALGNGVRFRLMAGQGYDITQCLMLIEDLACEYVIVDKGYDVCAFVAQFSEMVTV